MKKLVSILLVLMTLMPLGLAEESNLESLTLNELVSLSATVNAEIIRRRENPGKTLTAGDYTVGEDLQAGKYIFTVTSVVKFSPDSSSYCLISLEDVDGGSMLYAGFLEPDDTFYFPLEDGMHLSIYSGEGILSLATQSWVVD